MIHKTSSDFVNESISLHLDTTACRKTIFTFASSLDTLKHLSHSTRNKTLRWLERKLVHTNHVRACQTLFEQGNCF